MSAYRFPDSTLAVVRHDDEVMGREIAVSVSLCRAPALPSSGFVLTNVRSSSSEAA